jgi:hypothetical protein
MIKVLRKKISAKRTDLFSSTRTRSTRSTLITIQKQRKPSKVKPSPEMPRTRMTMKCGGYRLIRMRNCSQESLILLRNLAASSALEARKQRSLHWSQSKLTLWIRPRNGTNAKIRRCLQFRRNPRGSSAVFSLVAPRRSSEISCPGAKAETTLRTPD